MKRTETQRQQKEARLQGAAHTAVFFRSLMSISDLIELFGIRQQAASQRAA
jgi:hypothetical protein